MACRRILATGGGEWRWWPAATAAVVSRQPSAAHSTAGCRAATVNTSAGEYVGFGPWVLLGKQWLVRLHTAMMVEGQVSVGDLG